MPIPESFVILCRQTKNSQTMDKGTTNSGIPVFGRIVKMIDKDDVMRIAAKLEVDRYTKRLNGYQHLLIMLFAALGDFVSLRELELGFMAAASRMNHMGMDYMVRRSTLSDANARRDSAFFEAVYNSLLARHKFVLSDSRPVKGLKRRLFIMDSTTITLFSQVFRGTGRNTINGKKKGGVKAHTVIRADEDAPSFVVITDAATHDHVLLSQLPVPAGSFLVFDMGYVDYEAWQGFTDSDIHYLTREKKKRRYKVLESRDVPEKAASKVVSDEIVELSWRKRLERPMTDEELSHRRGRRPKNGVVMVKENRSGKHKCRRITAWKDDPSEGTITFITNDFETDADVLCEIYRRRWQIETLFKRLKQNFPLKYFLGDNQNAIQIQIWVCLIAWLLMTVIKNGSKRKWSMSNLKVSVRILLLSYVDLNVFLDLPEAQWLAAIEARQAAQTRAEAWPSLFNERRGPVFENKKTMAYLKAVSNEK